MMKVFGNFWGLILDSPNLKFSQVVERSFKVTKATLSLDPGGNSNLFPSGSVSVHVLSSDCRDSVQICVLNAQNPNTDLDLLFRKGDSVCIVAFYGDRVQRRAKVHLSGYLTEKRSLENNEEKMIKKENIKDENNNPDKVKVEPHPVENGETPKVASTATVDDELGEVGRKKKISSRKRKAEKQKQKKKELMKEFNDAGIQIKDIKIGQGPEPNVGDQMKIRYTGKCISNGKSFCSPKSIAKIRLGNRDVIHGVDIGIKGMREGGKRKMIIPPEYAFGDKGLPALVPPNSKVEVVVEIVRKLK